MTDEFKAPQIYAGNKFYDRIMDTMKNTQQAMLVGDFTSWVSLLRQLDNWLSGHTPDDLLAFQLGRLQRRADKITNASRNNPGYRRVSSSQWIDLREEIIKAERQLFANAKEFLIRTDFGEEEAEKAIMR